ncbi:hypothetical protein ACA910_001613 [Epithemia clementina (nom. ined.)]
MVDVGAEDQDKETQEGLHQDDEAKEDDDAINVSIQVTQKEIEAALYEMRLGTSARSDEPFPDSFEDDEAYPQWKQENNTHYKAMEKKVACYPRNDKYKLSVLTEIFSKSEGDGLLELPTIMSAYGRQQKNNNGDG